MNFFWSESEVCKEKFMFWQERKGTVTVIFGDGEEDKDAVVLVVVGGGVDGLVAFGLGAKKREMICCFCLHMVRLKGFEN